MPHVHEISIKNFKRNAILGPSFHSHQFAIPENSHEGLLELYLEH